MANDVKAMDMINNATMFPVVTSAVVGSVVVSSFNDVGCTGRGNKNRDASKALWYERGLNSS